MSQVKSSTQSPQRKFTLTAHDYRALPEGGPRYQLIGGEMHMAPAPNRYHQRIAMNITLILGPYLQKNPIGELYFAPFDVYLTDQDVYQPDLVYVAKAHASVLTDAGAEGAPDLVVEILSRRTTVQDRGLKREVYARTGVAELWIVDPQARRLEVLYLQQDPRVPAATHGDQAVFTSPLFPGLEFEMATIFRE